MDAIQIWEEYRIDQEINDRGIEVDMDLVEQALRLDALSREKLTAAMKRMTEMENPNSVQQMKDWLSQNGMDVDSLGKKEVAALMRACPPELRKVLILRQQLAKSSVRKYTAMRNAVCADRRARGMFRFYGANRTEADPVAKSAPESPAGSGRSEGIGKMRRYGRARNAV